jgi:NTE family protein
MSVADVAVRPGVGVAFGGGVAYSIAGVGIARVLEEEGLPIAAASGTSGGAFVAAAVAAGLRGWELQQAAEEIRWHDLVRLAPGRMGLLSGEPMERHVERIAGRRDFAELPMPLCVVATDLLRAEEIRFTSGPLGFAVRASSAIPGFFQPVPWEGKLLADGGITDNLPVGGVRAFAPAVALAVDVLTRSDQYQGPLRSAAQVMLKAYHTMVRRNLELQERHADLVVQPDMSGLSVMNFRDVPRIIARGREAMAPLVPRLRALLAERLDGRERLACPL